MYFLSQRSRRLLWRSSLALVTTFALACNGTIDDDGSEDPEANPEDYPTVPVSEACGGKCDDPDAVLNASDARLVSELSLREHVVEEGINETMVLEAPVIEEELENLTDEATLAAQIYAADGAANQDYKIEATLYFDRDAGVFVSDTVDTSDLLPWQLLRIDLGGLFGETEIAQTFEFAPGIDTGTELIPEAEDPFAQALDVELPVIYIDPEVPAPDYHRPTADGFNLGGTEFWQRWPDGHSPTFSYTAGTELGRKCMTASAMRFEAIMADPPAGIVELKENSNWSGRFFNWNDDYSDERASSRPTGAVLWAWRTTLVKWISQTGDDGSCFLPTRSMVERAAENCLAEAQASDGAIEGCQAY